MKRTPVSLSKRLQVTLASLLGWALFIGIGSTLRFRILGKEHYQNLRRKGQNFLIAVWHGRIFLPVYALRNQNIAVIVSQHWDGEMIARTIRMLGYRAIRGSSTRGGKKAFHDMVAYLRSGGVGANIPDGPTGPPRQLKLGTLFLAQRSGVPILPMSFSTTKGKKFRSWDRFLLPLPFSRVSLIFGEPLVVPPNVDEKQINRLAQTLEARLTKIERKADESCQI